MRPGDGSNKGSLAQVAVAGRFGGRQSFQDFYLPGLRGGAGGTLFLP
jgi:hypothetical protein